VCMDSGICPRGDNQRRRVGGANVRASWRAARPSTLSAIYLPGVVACANRAAESLPTGGRPINRQRRTGHISANALHAHNEMPTAPSCNMAAVHDQYGRSDNGIVLSTIKEKVSK